MFASASASLASRVPVRLGERRGRSAAKVNTSARAATTYTLDGKGCAGARTGDTGEFKNNIVAYKKRDAPACPIKPIAVTELCASHEGGKFKMLDAIFEQVGDDLQVLHRNHAALPRLVANMDDEEEGPLYRGCTNLDKFNAEAVGEPDGTRRRFCVEFLGMFRSDSVLTITSNLIPTPSLSDPSSSQSPQLSSRLLL